MALYRLHDHTGDDLGDGLAALASRAVGASDGEVSRVLAGAESIPLATRNAKTAPGQEP